MNSSTPSPPPSGRRSATPAASMTLRCAGVTDIGLKRQANQDAIAMLPEYQLFVLADGMGGHAAGEVAARLAVDSMGEFFEETAAIEPAKMTWPKSMPEHLSYPEKRLVNAISHANTAIYEASLQEESRRGMGTTIAALAFHDEQAYWAHVGDSRVYRMRQHRLTPLTADHSLLNETIRHKGLTGQERTDFIARFPYKHVLVRALGLKYSVEIDISHGPVQDGDLFLLSSDGLHSLLSTQDIAHILHEHRTDLRACTYAMVDAAKVRGGHDNISVIVVEARQE